MKLRELYEGGMPPNVIKHKQRLSLMNKEEFNDYIKKAAKERNRTPVEHAKQLERLHAVSPDKYVNRLTEATYGKAKYEKTDSDFDTLIDYKGDGKFERLGSFYSESTAKREGRENCPDGKKYKVVNTKTKESKTYTRGKGD